MVKILLIVLLTLIVSFLLFFPFWHVGGHYYRGLLLIYDIRKQTSSGGFLPPLPFSYEVTLLKWADPTSFQYVHGGQYYSYAKDRFSVYCLYQLDGFDPNTFKPVQPPITEEWFYIDKNNARFYNALILKSVSGERYGNGKDIVTDKFDMDSFQPLGANIFKDKNGVYTYFRSAPFLENMNQPDGWGDCRIELFKKNEELNADTFKIDFCDEKNCQASDKNGKYIFKRVPNNWTLDIQKLP